MIEETSVARRLHDASVFVDAHHPVWNGFVQTKFRGGEHVFDALYAPRLREGGVDVINLVVAGDHTAQVIDSASDFHFWDANKILDMLLSEEEEGSDSFVLCRNAGDIDRAMEESRIAILTTVAGGRPLEGKPNLNLLSNLRNLYRLGLRGVQLTGNGRNRLADGAAQARTKGGLTHFGAQVVREMERLGMVVDVAQLSDYGFWHVLEHTGDPVIDSHSNAGAVCDHPRNLGDDRIRAMVERGGVIGLSFYAALVSDGPEKPTVEDLMRHVDHIADLAGGVDNISFGPNFSGFGTLTPTQLEKHPGWIEGINYGIRENDFIEGMDGVAGLPLVTEALVSRGYSEEDVGKILGGNFLRLYRRVLG